MKIIINTALAPAPIGPYSQAVLADNTLYVSGQIALIPESGKMSQASITEEAHQVMQNIKAILEEAGMSFSNVVKTSIFLKNISNFTLVNEVYGSYFSGDFPARETVEVARLPKEANVEISVTAVKK
ncbi:MAG: RidA family protein [Bacteroidetes bacterium]|nr:RidA family protein [Bacteroidota bacterium]